MSQNPPPNLRPIKASQLVRFLREGAIPTVRTLLRPSTLAQLPRLFKEGIAPARRMFIQAHNNREMARMIREKAQVTFVCSFARSGNTWMRYLMCDVLLQNQGFVTTTELAVDPGRIIPDYYAQMIARRDTSVKTPGHLIKTHDLIPMLQAHIGGDPGVRQCRYLYLYRTPEDALVSLFHLYLREKYIRSKAGRDIDLFCLEALPTWVEHLKSYLDALDEGGDIHLVFYDQLLRQTTAVLRDTLEWLGVPYTDAVLNHADSNMKFGNLQAMEAKTLGGRIPFFRRGSDGSGSKELKPETLSRIRDATQHVFARANERLARQSMRTQAIRNAPPFSVNRENRNGNEKVLPASTAR
jgi:Sulfotransferase domain